MPSSPSERLRVALVAVVIVGWASCDELNPDYDPDAGPVCSPGERQCNPDSGVREVCQADRSWTPLQECWTGSGCSDGVCLPDSPFERCDSAVDCTDASDLCTVFVDPDQPLFLGTFCVAPPNPTGRPGGQACSAPEDCASGWCFRFVCYEACANASHCTNVQHECDVLDVTVDGVRDQNRIHGCVPPPP